MGAILRNSRMDCDLDQWYDFVLDLTMQCGEIIKGATEEAMNIEEKDSDFDLVTYYDRRVEEILIGGITKQYPDHKFIGEETTYINNNTIPPLTDAPTWIIDPIDGTSNFVNGLSLSCISIGLTCKKQLEIGIIYNPFLGELYTARKGQGAFLNGKRLRTNRTQDFKKCLVADETSFAALANCRDITLSRLRGISYECHGIRSFGCAALTMAYVARGSLGAYHIDFLKPWDIAAGTLIIQEAGGCVLNTSGSEIDIMVPKMICGCTEAVARKFVEIIKRADKERNETNIAQG